MHFWLPSHFKLFIKRSFLFTWIFFLQKSSLNLLFKSVDTCPAGHGYHWFSSILIGWSVVIWLNTALSLATSFSFPLFAIDGYLPSNSSLLLSGYDGFVPHNQSTTEQLLQARQECQCNAKLVYFKKNKVQICFQ